MIQTYYFTTFHSDKTEHKLGPLGTQVYSGGPKYFQVGLPCWVSQIFVMEISEEIHGYLDTIRKWVKERVLPDGRIALKGHSLEKAQCMNDFMPTGYPQFVRSIDSVGV